MIADNEFLKNAKGLEEKCMWPEAAAQYCEALTNNNSVTLHERAAWCFSRAGQYSSAIEHLLLLYQREPAIAKWPYMIGYQYYCEKKWDAAIEWYEKSLVLNPNYFVVKYRLAYAYVQVSGEHKKLTKAEYWKALGHIKECHKLWMSFSEDKQRKESGTYFDINFLHGKMLMGLPNNRADAIALFQRALQIKPDDDICKYNLAKTYYLLGEYEKAKQSIPIGNQYYIAELNAYIDAKCEKYDQAINQIKQLLQRRQKDYLYCFLAEVYLLLDDLENAYDMSEKAITLGRNNHKNYYVAAKVYIRFGLLLKATSMLDTAIQLKEKRYSSDYVECKSLKDEIASQIAPTYVDDEELLKRLAGRHSKRSDNNQRGISGIICKYNSDKGFGFIQHDNGQNIFFHISNCKFKNITVGDTVSFQTVNTAKGINAVEIVRIINKK